MVELIMEGFNVLNRANYSSYSGNIRSALFLKPKTRKQCEKLVPRFLRAVIELHQSGLAQW